MGPGDAGRTRAAQTAAEVLGDLRWPSQNAEFPPACLRFVKSWSMSGKRVAENLITFSLSSGIALLLGLIYKPYTWEFLFMLK